MRRLPALALVAALLVPAACGGDDDDGPVAEINPSVGPFTLPTVSNAALGTDPTIISDSAAPEESVLKVLHEGTGRKITPGDILVTEVKGQVWDVGGIELPAFVNSFESGQLYIRPVDGVVPAWEKKLPGVRVGSRVLLVAPPADGFGAEGDSGLGIFPNDSVIFVIDIIDAVPENRMARGEPVDEPADPDLPSVGSGKNPKITIPDADPPSGLISRLLLAGDGDKIAEGQRIVAHYVGVLWRNGDVFDSSWEPGRGPFEARIGTSDPETGQPGVIKGWVEGLVGERVGSRILLVVPPKLGYGKAGFAEAGIKGTDTLVFVVDVLGVYGEPT